MRVLWPSVALDDRDEGHSNRLLVLPVVERSDCLEAKMNQPELIDLAKQCYISAADCFELTQRPRVEMALEVLYDMELCDVLPENLSPEELEFLRKVYRGYWKAFGCAPVKEFQALPAFYDQVSLPGQSLQASGGERGGPPVGSPSLALIIALTLQLMGA